MSKKKKPRTDIKRVHIGSGFFCPDFLIAKGALTDLDMCNVGTQTSCFNGQLFKYHVHLLYFKEDRFTTLFLNFIA